MSSASERNNSFGEVKEIRMGEMEENESSLHCYCPEDYMQHSELHWASNRQPLDSGPNFKATTPYLPLLIEILLGGENYGTLLKYTW